MPDDLIPPKLKPGFIDVDSRSTQKVYQPPTLMRTTEWGGLTMLSLLASFLFPPYFITVLAIAFLNAGGLLWVTHLSEKGRKALIDFEIEFRKGFELEEAGRLSEAMAAYTPLVKRYQEFPKISEIAQHRIELLQAKLPVKIVKKPKPKLKTKSKKR